MSDLKQTTALTPLTVPDDLAKRVEREAPVYELSGKKFVVTVDVFDLLDDDKPGKHVPADQFAKLIEKEIKLCAAKSVREAMILRIVVANIKAPVMEARAKVEVRTTAPHGMFVHGHEVAQFLFQLRDDIIEIIEEIKPPKRAWVAIGKGQAPTEGVSKDDRPGPSRPDAADGSPGRGAGARPRRRTRTNAKRRRLGSRPRAKQQPSSAD